MQWHKVSKDLIVLSIILGCLFGAMLGNFPLHTPDASRYAEIPREMLFYHDFITPHLNGLKYFEKPPLFYWIQVFNFKLFGINILTANLANALMALITCLSVYLFSAKLYNCRVGFISSLVLGTSLLFFGMNHVVTTDVALTCFITLALCCFILGANYPPNTKKNIWLLICVGIFLACSVLTKGLIGIILPSMIAFLWIVFFKQWNVFKSKGILYAILVFFALALPWHLLIQQRNPEFFHFYFVEQHFLRYLTTYAGRVQPWWFFPAVLICGFFPWTNFLLQAIKDHAVDLKNVFNNGFNNGFKNIFQHKTNNANFIQHTNIWFFIIWAVSIYVFYAFSYSRLIPYLLPIFPALAIIIGKFFADNWQIKHRLSFTLGFLSFAVFSVAIGCIMLVIHDRIDFINTKPILNIMFYVSGSCFLIGGITTFLRYYFQGIAQGCKTLICTMLIILLTLTQFMFIFNKNSTLVFAEYLHKHLQNDDEIVAFNNYYQDLPFYLQRIITVVNYKGELAFGIAHDTNSKNWMISSADFEKRWLGKHKVYMIIEINDYNALPLHLKQTTHPLLKFTDKILVVNKL